MISNYSVNINRLPTLQPAVCMYFIPSLLFFADVQAFCSEKESLFVTLESFKERETTRPLSVSPSLPLLQFSRQNNRSLSPCSVCSPSCRAPPTRVPCKAQITGSVVIYNYLEQIMTVVCGDVDEGHFCLVLFCSDFFSEQRLIEK